MQSAAILTNYYLHPNKSIEDHCRLHRAVAGAAVRVAPLEHVAVTGRGADVGGVGPGRAEGLRAPKHDEEDDHLVHTLAADVPDHLRAEKSRLAVGLVREQLLPVGLLGGQRQCAHGVHDEVDPQQLQEAEERDRRRRETRKVFLVLVE